MADWQIHAWNKNRYLSRDFQAPFGRFSFRIFQNGRLNIYVTAEPPGLDDRGLLDLLMRINAEVYALTGTHVRPDDIQIRGPTEQNFDSSVPGLKQLLRIEGVKSIFTYSELLGAYARIYEKGSKVRIETGGHPGNASMLYRGLRTPIDILEQQAALPEEMRLTMNEINQRVDVLTQGLGNVNQRSLRLEELTAQMIMAVTTSTKALEKFTSAVQELVELQSTPKDFREKKP